MRRSSIFVVNVLLALSLLIVPFNVLAQSPVPAPIQGPPPSTGPGSDASSRYPGARMTQYGPTGGGVWITEPTSDPDGSTPVAAEPLPVILHFNGCCGENGRPTPEELEDWFLHLARQGYVIIAPVYTDGIVLDSSMTWFDEAIAELAKPGHASIDLDRLAVTAYSYGSAAALEYTETAEVEGRPVPHALFVMAPCVGRYCPEIPQVASLPEGLKAVVMAFDADEIPAVEWPQRYFSQLLSLPATDRNYIELRSDDHGSPPLLADHLVGLAPVDMLDQWGFWKVADGLFACAFTGEDCEYALGNAPELLNMGTWSDGVPVRQLTVSTDPVADWALPAAAVSPDAASFLAPDPTLETITAFGFPQSLTVGPDGRLYAINGSMSRIEILDSAGESVDSFGKVGSGPGKFQFQPPDLPFFGFGDLAFASDGSLYVADAYNNRVQIFDSDFQFVTEVGADPADPGMLLTASGIALDEANDRFFVTSYSEGAVKVYSMDGTYIERWGTDGPGGAFFNQPSDVVVAPDGSVYVAEFGRSRVHHFSADGTPLSVIGGSGSEPGQLAEPRGIALDADGNLYVAEYNTVGYGNSRVQVFSPEGEVLGIVTGLDDMTKFMAPTAVSILPDGTILISDDQSRSIYRFVRSTSD